MEEGKKMRKEKEKTKKERKTATINWSCCRLASLGRLTLLLRLFGSEREKCGLPSSFLLFLPTHFSMCACICAGARVPADEVSATGEVAATSNAIR